MPLKIGQPVDHGFDEPLGLLSDCHRRIEHFLHVLQTVVSKAEGGPLTHEFRAALEASLRYFSMAAPKHTADEEMSLFPRLRASEHPGAVAALKSLEALEHDHDEADAHHASVHALARRWLAADRLLPEETSQLREHLKRLEALYQRHITIEDQEVLPAAARALDHRNIGHWKRNGGTARRTGA